MGLYFYNIQANFLIQALFAVLCCSYKFDPDQTHSTMREPIKNNKDLTNQLIVLRHALRKVCCEFALYANTLEYSE